MTASVGKLEVRVRPARGPTVAPAAAVEFGYGSNAGVGTIVSASWMRALRDVADRRHQDAFVEPVGQQHPLGIDVEVTARIASTQARDTTGRSRCRSASAAGSPRSRAASSRRCSRSGAAEGRRRDRDSPGSACQRLTAVPLRGIRPAASSRTRSIARGRSALPRARARSRRRRSREPAAVSRCTVICRTKSAADSPPRTRAAPAVGSTWFEPIA